MNFSCKEQLSGIAEIDFLLLDEVNNWPIVLTDQNSSQLIFTPEANSVDAEIEPNSINIRVNKKEVQSGIINQINVKMNFITRSESLEQLLEQYEKKPGIVLAKLNNGFRRIYGTNEEPLYLMYEVDDADFPTGKGITSIEIKGETSQRPVYYTV
jgi:hypothetical protein